LLFCVTDKQAIYETHLPVTVLQLHLTYTQHNIHILFLVAQCQPQLNMTTIQAATGNCSYCG